MLAGLGVIQVAAAGIGLLGSTPLARHRKTVRPDAAIVTRPVRPIYVRLRQAA